MGAVFGSSKNKTAGSKKAWVKVESPISTLSEIGFDGIGTQFYVSERRWIDQVFKKKIKADNALPHFPVIVIGPEKILRRGFFFDRPELGDQTQSYRCKIRIGTSEHPHNQKFFVKCFVCSHSDCLLPDFIAYFRSMNTRIIAFFAILVALFGIDSTVFSQVDAPDELVTVFNTTPLEFDLHQSIYSNEAQIFTALYEGLCTYDPASLDPVPAVASSWSKSSDGKTYTFVLRQSARWSDGTRVVSQDFKNSWLRLLSLNGDYATFCDIIAGARDFRLGITKDPGTVGIETPDDHTLVVKLVRPAAYFTRLLCHHSFAPIHPSMLKAEDWQARIPFPVDGPYRFVSYDASGLRLEKNPYYWDANSVSIPKLTMLFSDDDVLASKMFNNDQVQWLAGPGDFDSILLQSAIQVNPIFATHYWYFNCQTAPWNDARVREALAYLVPWDSVRSSDYYAVIAQTLVLPLPGYSEARGITESDKNKALQLLKDAGYPEGQGLPTVRLCYAQGSKDSERVAMEFQKAWQNALPTLSVDLAPVDSSRYYELVDKGKVDYTLANSTWIGDFADPEAFLQMWASESPLNNAGYKSQSFTETLEKSYAKDGKERMSLLAKAETILLQEAAVLPIYHSLAASVIDTDLVNGWYQNALDIHPYKYLKFGTPQVQPNIAKAEQHHEAGL